MKERSWRYRLARMIAGREIEAAVREAEEVDTGWRTVYSAGQREIPYTDLRNTLELVDEAYRENPVAYRIVELGVDFVLGRGLALRSDDAGEQRWLDEWWNEPQNNWGMRQFEMCRELSLAGEVFVTLHTNPMDGMTYVRQVPGVLIDEVETSPDDLEDEIRYRQVAQVGVVDGLRWAGGVASIEGRWWPRESAGSEPVMRHYAVNRLVGSVRGQSDLQVLQPWLRRYKDWLTDRVRLNRYRQAFLFDVTLKGADRRAVVARQNELREPPEPGSVMIHNDSEVWAAINPQLASGEAGLDGQALRLMIAAGSGFPLHFLGEAAEANLATATAMEMPTVRRLERRQRYFGWLMTDLARECARRTRRFDGLDVRCEFEALRAEDLAGLAGAVRQMVDACAVARDRGWLRDDEARELFARFSGQASWGEGILADDARLPKPATTSTEGCNGKAGGSGRPERGGK